MRQATQAGSGGRKEEIGPGDVLGALTADAGKIKGKSVKVRLL